MILFTTLLLTLAVLFIVALVTLLTGGLAFVLAFGDIIVFVLLIALVVKLSNRNKRK